MKTHIWNYVFYMAVFIFAISACEEASLISFNPINNKGLPIEARSFDDECELCNEALVETCCCRVELQPNASAVSVQVCGIIEDLAHSGSTYDGCTLSTEIDECYTFSEYGVTKFLSGFDPKLYFCIPKGGAYAVKNLSTTTTTRLWVGCDDSGSPSGNYGIVLEPEEAYYFQTSSIDCDITLCPLKKVVY